MVFDKLRKEVIMYDISKLIQSWEDEYRRFSQLIEHGKPELLTRNDLMEALLQHCQDLREIEDKL